MGKQIVNVPSFLVRVDSQKHIDFALNSPFGGGRPGRNKRKAQKCVARACNQSWIFAKTWCDRKGTQLAVIELLFFLN